MERAAEKVGERAGSEPGSLSGLAAAVLIWAGVLYGLVSPPPQQQAGRAPPACKACPK